MGFLIIAEWTIIIIWINNGIIVAALNICLN